MLNGHLNLNKLIFLEKELRKTNQEGFRIKKVTQKGYHNSFSSWIDKKDFMEENYRV